MAKRPSPQTTNPTSAEPSATIQIALQWQESPDVHIESADYMHYRILSDKTLLTIGHYDLRPNDEPSPSHPISVRALGRYAITHECLRSWAALLNAAVARLPKAEESK